MAIEAMTRGIVNKIMHTPITTLKTAARDPEQTTIIELVRRIFNLHERIPSSSEEPETSAKHNRGEHS